MYFKKYNQNLLKFVPNRTSSPAREYFKLQRFVLIKYFVVVSQKNMSNKKRNLGGVM